jgi:hypothetical protein
MERGSGTVSGYRIFGLANEGLQERVATSRARPESPRILAALYRNVSSDRFWESIINSASAHLFFETQETNFALASSIEVRPLAG